MSSNLPVLELSPGWGASVSTKLEFSESPLGDRYQSRVGSTIAPSRIWNIRKVTNTIERDSIVSQLKLYSETIQLFLWSPHPDFLRVAFFCDRFSESQLGPDSWEIQAAFTQSIQGESENFADLIDDTVVDNLLAGSLTWLQTYTRDTLPLAANSSYVTVNAFHNVLGRGGYFPGSAGTTEGQAALGRACMEAFFQTQDTQWRDYAINLGNALISEYYNDPVPTSGNEFDTIWAPHWLINVKEAFVSRGPQDSTDPLNYGDFGRIITFTNGEGSIPNGTPENGELLAVVYKVYSVDGTLLWTNVDSPLVAGTEYAINYFVSDFQLKGQNFRIFADTESSGGTPPVVTAEPAGKIVLTGTYSGQARLVYSTYTGPVIQINQLFEPYPLWRPLL